MNRRAEAFVAANKAAPVVKGRVIGQGGKGAIYELADGQRFRLNRADCAEAGPPRWVHDLPGYQA